MKDANVVRLYRHFIDLHLMSAVSYTHLDVYKRQDSDKVKFLSYRGIGFNR